MISSLTNDFVKYLDKLKLKKYRDIEHKFIVEGEHLVQEAEKNELLEKIIVVDGYEYKSKIETIVVSEDVMKKVSLLDTPSKVIGLCKMKDEKEIGEKVVILDDIQDPGNLGTIIRSSLAFNIDTIVLSLNTVDLYNPKVIRATQGMLFNINIIRKDLVDVIKDKIKYALVVGNEGNGVRDNISLLADTRINININKKVESLNVGVATSIILYELER